ncbi:MAG: DMT family transporter [Myxococcota bacterium]|nr:DMT family transporter [Myxococcota bacterium]
MVIERNMWISDTPYIGHIASISAAALWAVASILFTRLGSTINALVLNLLKTGIACILMLLTLKLAAGHFWPQTMTKAELAWLAGSGLLGLTVGDTLLFMAFNRVGPRKSLLFMTLAPPTTALLAWPFLGEPITLKMCLGILVTIFGVALIIDDREDSASEESDKVGLMLAAAAALCQAVGNIGTKLGGHHAPLEMGLVRITFGTVGLVILVLLTRKIRSELRPLKHGKTLFMVLVATLLGTYLGIWLQVAGLRFAPAGIAATLSSTSPIFVLPLAAIWLHDRLTGRSIWAALIATLGMALLFDIG